MTSHHDERPVDLGDTPDEEGIEAADVSEDSDEDPDVKLNYTERHPEHFRNPPGHVRELREEDEE